MKLDFNTRIVKFTAIFPIATAVWRKFLNYFSLIRRRINVTRVDITKRTLETLKVDQTVKMHHHPKPQSSVQCTPMPDVTLRAACILSMGLAAKMFTAVVLRLTKMQLQLNVAYMHYQTLKAIFITLEYVKNIAVESGIVTAIHIQRRTYQLTEFGRRVKPATSLLIS